MSGAGFKTFNTGDVLTSSDVNTYLMQQTVMVFDDASARSTALGANVAEGMFSYLKDTNLTYRYDGSSWLSDAGTTSPLTTKGDVWGYSTTDARIPVGANGTVLTADSAEALGVKWAVDPVADVVTTAGDILYATAADTITRLGIGTAGQVLTVNSGATAPEWAAAGGASGLTLITQNTFSNVANVTIDNVFSTTYRNYIVYVNAYAGTNADDFQLQFRYGSTTLTGSNYYGGGFHYKPDNSIVTFGFSGATQATLAADSGVSNRRSSYQINFNQVGTGSSTEPNFFGIGFSNQGEKTTQFSCGSDATQNFTGFLLKSSSSNITGEYQVYGLAI